MVTKPNNTISETKTLFSIALDIGVSEYTLWKYSKGLKVKPSTKELIERYREYPEQKRHAELVSASKTKER